MTSTKLIVVLESLFALLNITSGSVPSAPTNVTIKGTGSRSINISWTRPAQDGNSSQLEYAVFYTQIRDNGLWVLPVRGDTKAQLSKLKPNIKYDIYVMAKNDEGYGSPTSKRSATTSEEAPEKCPELEHTPERESNGLDIRIDWGEVSEEYQNGPIQGYVIFYRGKSMSSTKSVNVTNPNTKSYVFRNFPKEENYGFRVAAFNSKGLCKGYQNIPLDHEGDNPTTAPATRAPATTAPATTAPETTAPATTTEAPTPVKESTKGTTKEPSAATTQPPSEGGCKTEVPGEKHARVAESNWLVYVAIALAVIIVIMGVTIFLLIWQLYKNHRFYKLKQEQYKMRSTTPNMGMDNEAQDNAV